VFDLLRDFRLAFRAIGQNKSLTAIAVLALALGVGPNTAIFTYAKSRYPPRLEEAGGLYEGQQCNQRPHRCVWLFTPAV
jgi:hypothetical protein